MFWAYAVPGGFGTIGLIHVIWKRGFFNGKVLLNTRVRASKRG